MNYKKQQQANMRGVKHAGIYLETRPAHSSIVCVCLLCFLIESDDSFL